MKVIKRIMCVILAMTMLLSGISLTAMATGETTQNETENISGEDGITRVEWLKKLTTLFEMTVEDDNYPDNYFSDLDSASEYYYDMLLAVQFGLVNVETGGNINPEGLTTREFAAHTLNFCLSYQLNEDAEYTFSDVEDVEYPIDAQVAVNLGWLELKDGKFLPDEYVTTAEVDYMIDFAEEVWNSTEIDENHENIYEFDEDVIVIPEATAVVVDENQVVTITECPQEITEGDKFAVYQNGIPCTYEAKSVTTENGNIIIQTEELELDDAYEKIDAQGTLGADAIQYQEVEGVTLEVESANPNARGNIHLNQYTSLVNAKGKFDLGSGVSASVDVKIKDGIIEWGVNSTGETFVKLSGKTDISYGVSINTMEEICKDITIVPATVPGIGGVDLILEVDLGGSVKGTTKGYLVAGVAYSKENGFRLIKGFEATSFSLTIEAKGSIGIKQRLGLTGSLMPIKGYVWTKAGASASLKQTTYGEGTPKQCSTFAGWLYASCGGTVSFKLGIFSEEFSEEFIFFDEKHSPIRVYHHYEDGKEVTECCRGDEYWNGYYTSGLSRYHGSGWSEGYGAYGYDSEGNKIQIYEYELDENENAIITAYYGNAEVLYIPEEIDGYTVVGIGDNAFSCFAQKNRLVEVSIPDTVTSIGMRAFWKCITLEEIDIPDSVVSIGFQAFAETGLTSLELPSELVEFGGQMLSGTTGVKTLFVPKTVVRDYEAYGGLDGSSVETLEFEDGITNVPYSIAKGATKLTKVIIPETVTEVRREAFWGCSSLEEIKIPEAVVSIAYGAFAETGLTSLQLPSKLKEFGGEMLSGTTGVTTIFIPKSVTTMNHSTEYGGLAGSSVETVEFERGMTSIPAAAAKGATKLTKVIIPDTVTEIQREAFSGCSALEGIDIPESVVTIEFEAFAKSGLTSLKLPSNLTKFGGKMLSGTTGVTTVFIPKTVTTMNHSTTHGGLAGSSVETVEFETGITKIPAAAAKGATKLTEVIIPDTVAEIEMEAFLGCSSLEGINIPETVTDFGTYVFQNCSSLKEISLPENRYEITNYMFAGCTSLETFTLPESTTSIGDSAFKDCTSLKKVNWNNAITTVNASAFQNCDNLADIEIPNSVTVLGKKVFYDCDLLTSVLLGTGITSIPESTFEHCDVLESIVLPYRVASIGKNAFKDNVKFKEITIPRKTELIDATAFSYPAQLIIYGVSGTYAETFANENNITFVNKNVPATEVVLDTKALTLNKGVSAVLSMTVTPADFTDAVSWKSTDTSVVTIAEDGIVKAVGLGTATIKLIVGDVSASCKVTVVQPVTSISLNKTSVTLEALDTYQLTATVKPDTAANKEVKWTSSDESIAKVDENGLVTAYTKGIATITVTAQDGSNVTNKCTVTVASSAIIAETLEELESNHNYEDNLSKFWVYTEKDAAELKVTFDKQTNIEEDFDFLYVYDGEGNEIGKYTGTELAGQTIVVPGDTIRIKLVSDESGNEWGFKVTKIEVVNPEEPIIANGYSGDTEWTLTESGTLKFTGEGVMKNYTYKSEMPWYSYLDQIKSVVIEDGVTRIGDYAFYGMSVLENITIPYSITTIGEYAFKNATALDNVVLPTGLTKLGESAFYGCTALTSIEIPASLWTVQPYTFKNCTSLAEVTFNEGNLQKISDGAFYNTGLTKVVLPDCLDILDVYTFKNCTKLADITIGNELTELREAVFYGTAIDTITIPEGIKKIGPYAFKNCTNLMSVDLPETLTSVGEASFYACTNLEAIDFPYAVTTIGNYAFRRCIGLASVTFGKELVTIGECSFYGCTGITELVIPDKVTGIEAYAFKGCTSLSEVTLGASVNKIKDSAFHTCTSLKKLVIPASVGSIGEYCFSGSYNLWQLIFEGDAPSIGTGAFKGLNATAYYPAGNATWTSGKMQNYGGTIVWEENISFELEDIE